LFRCTTNNVACIKGTIHSWSCFACAKAKQKCEGATFLKVEKPAVPNAVAVGAEAIVDALTDITKILRGMRTDLRGVAFAVENCWARGGEESSDNEEDRMNEDEECDADVPELREEMLQYQDFVWEKLGREIPGFDDKPAEEEEGEETGGPSESADNAP
jgi:hypothetical protein